MSRRRFFQKTNEQIWFVCCEKQKSKLNKFIGLFVPFLGEPTARKSAFGFICPLWPFMKKFIFAILSSPGILFASLLFATLWYKQSCIEPLKIPYLLPLIHTHTPVWSVVENIQPSSFMDGVNSSVLVHTVRCNHILFI